METNGKPEIAILGDAARLIQSSKPNHGDGGNPIAFKGLDEELE